MAAAASMDTTSLLVAWSDGDEQALGELMPRVYGELRQLASWSLRGERGQHAFQTTELVHDAFLRLIDQQSVGWKNRAHFFGIAAQMMRRILVDHARQFLYLSARSSLASIILISPGCSMAAPPTTACPTW